LTGGGGAVNTTGTFTTGAIVTAAGPDLIQTPDATATLDSSGDLDISGTLLASEGTTLQVVLNTAVALTLIGDNFSSHILDIDNHGSTLLSWFDATGNLHNPGYFVGSTAGVSAGAFSAITSIQSTGGIVTTLTGTSDSRLKNIDAPFTRGIEAIMALHPALFHWNPEGQKITGFPASLQQAGFIAQDVQKAIPEAVGIEPHDGVDYLNLNDRPIVAALVNAVQEQQKEIEELKSEISALKASQK
jgi:hypothetical protein